MKLWRLGKMRWHWQNLSAERRDGAWPRHGRAWLSVGMSHDFCFEWNLFKIRCALGLQTNEQGKDITLHVAPVFASFFLTVPCPRWVSHRLLPRHHYEYEGEQRWYPEDREVSLSIHGGSLWWTLGVDPFGGSTYPTNWRDGSFSPVRALLGKRIYERTDHKATEVLIPMPEGNYKGMVMRVDTKRRRRRWPFWRHSAHYNLDIPGGIPYEGKGENSWDCGTDGLFGIGGTTPEAAVANAVRFVMERRERHGTPTFVKQADKKMAAGWSEAS